MKRGAYLVSVAALAAIASGVLAQEPAIILNDGGIQFPDGSLQSVAAGGSPAPVGETGQTQCFDASGVEIICAGTGHDGDLRGGVEWPSPRFTDEGDGTVTDKLTGLMWLKDAGCFGSSVTWTASFTTVASLNAGNEHSCVDYAAGTFSDWRLPNIAEMISLLDWGSTDALPEGHPFAFTGIGVCTFWSSTTNLSNPSEARIVNFGPSLTTITIGSTLKTGDFCTWPVRGGQ